MTPPTASFMTPDIARDLRDLKLTNYFYTQTCTRCNRNFVPGMTIGAWDCLVHPGVFCPKIHQWTCCDSRVPACMASRPSGCVRADHVGASAPRAGPSFEPQPFPAALFRFLEPQLTKNKNWRHSADGKNVEVWLCDQAQLRAARMRDDYLVGHSRDCCRVE